MCLSVTPVSLALLCGQPCRCLSVASVLTATSAFQMFVCNFCTFCSAVLTALKVFVSGFCIDSHLSTSGICLWFLYLLVCYIDGHVGVCQGLLYWQPSQHPRYLKLTCCSPVLTALLAPLVFVWNFYISWSAVLTFLSILYVFLLLCYVSAMLTDLSDCGICINSPLSTLGVHL